MKIKFDNIRSEWAQMPKPGEELEFRKPTEYMFDDFWNEPGQLNGEEINRRSKDLVMALHLRYNLANGIKYGTMDPMFYAADKMQAEGSVTRGIAYGMLDGKKLFELRGNIYAIAADKVSVKDDGSVEIDFEDGDARKLELSKSEDGRFELNMTLPDEDAFLKDAGYRNVGAGIYLSDDEYDKFADDSAVSKGEATAADKAMMARIGAMYANAADEAIRTDAAKDADARFLGPRLNESDRISQSSIDAAMNNAKHADKLIRANPTLEGFKADLEADTADGEPEATDERVYE